MVRTFKLCALASLREDQLFTIVSRQGAKPQRGFGLNPSCFAALGAVRKMEWQNDGGRMMRAGSCSPAHLLPKIYNLNRLPGLNEEIMVKHLG